MAVTTKAQRLAWMNLVRLKAAAGQRLKVGLFSNGTWDEDDDLASVVECVYNGYAQQTPNLTVEAINAGGESVCVSDPLTFSKTAGGAGDTVTGWFLEGQDDQGVDRLYGGDLFTDGPFDFTVDPASTTQIFFLKDKPY